MKVIVTQHIAITREVDVPRNMDDALVLAKFHMLPLPGTNTMIGALADASDTGHFEITRPELPVDFIL
jgi:hypothetical protein